MIIVLDDELCTADYVLLCVLIVPHDYCAGKQALYCWTRLAVWQYFTYFYQHVMVIIGQWSSLCRMTSSVLLITSCCVYVLYLQACHDQCAGWQALYYWPHHAVFMNCTYQHAMIIVLDDKLCTVEHVLLCDSTVLPACHDHCAGWQALYYWPHHAVFMNCTYQHAMIIVLDDKLCTVEHILLCICNVLTRMSW